MNPFLIILTLLFTSQPHERPLFMRENTGKDQLPAPNEAMLEFNEDRSPLIRTSSYKEAVENFFPRIPRENVRAGLQANLRLYIANSCQVFFTESTPDVLDKQV